MKILSIVSRLYKRHPVLGNVLVYGGLYSGGDISQQTLKKRPQYDLANASRIGLVGAGIFGPLAHFWYRYLDKVLPGTARKTIVRKIIVDQGVAGVLGVFIFYTATSVLEGKKSVLDDAVKKGPKTFMTGCVYWPTVQAVNFMFLPPQYRALYVAVAAFVWTNILCYLKSSDEIIGGI